MALPSTLLRSRNTCRTIVVRKIATGTSGIEYAPLLDRGTAYGRELHACQDQGDRRDRRDALARRPGRQDARGAPGQPEASWPRGPVHRSHERGGGAIRGAARRQRSLEFSRTGSGLIEGWPSSFVAARRRELRGCRFDVFDEALYRAHHAGHVELRHVEGEVVDSQRTRAADIGHHFAGRALERRPTASLGVRREVEQIPRREL